MFKIIQEAFRTGVVTTRYPDRPARVSESFRGMPIIDFVRWQDARPGAEVCPTEAIHVQHAGNIRTVIVDYGRCIFCGLCAGPEVQISRDFELATSNRSYLIITAEYELNANGTQHELREMRTGEREKNLRDEIHSVLGRSLSIREVDAGSCNGCEQEIVSLNNPIYDLEQYGIHFVASPRHADMLLVTGPVTRNMERALIKTYHATPDPKVVVAVGACGISGGIFGRNYATLGGVDSVIPVDVYIPGCPPRPQALLHGIFLAVGRLREKR